MRTLICDLNVYDEGHHIAYVKAIMNFSSDREDTVFLFNRKAADWCPGLKGDKRVFFVEEDFLGKNLKSVFLGKWREFKYIRGFAIQQAVDRVIFLEIDQYQAAIGMVPSPFRITGIYFRSFHKIGIRADSLTAMCRNAMYHVKKRLLFQVMRLNRKVEPVFLLNDRSGSRRYPRWFNYLPDPIFQAAGQKTPPSGLRASFQIPAASHVFLVFGAMGARKNIQHIVDAYSESRLAGPSVLLIAGKVRTDYREEFDRAVNGFIKDNRDPGKKLIVLDEFIDDGQVDEWFMISDTILLCYRKFYGSSGLMGIAARHGKTCIVPDKGLLFDLCREYDLGYAANTELPRSISDAMSLSERNPVAGPGQWRFVNDHSENAFLTTLWC